MKESFVSAHRAVKARMKQEDVSRDGEGRVLLSMTVRDDGDFLSTYSEGSTPVISSDVAEFLENSTVALRPDEELTLRICSNCVDETEKTVYRSAFREYYAQRYIANERELKRNRITVLLLTLVGVIALAVAILFSQLVGNAIGEEILDIVAWVFIWEAVDIGVFKNRSLRVSKLRYLAYLSMKVVYEPLEESA